MVSRQIGRDADTRGRAPLWPIFTIAVLCLVYAFTVLWSAPTLDAQNAQLLGIAATLNDAGRAAAFAEPTSWWSPLPVRVLALFVERMGLDFSLVLRVLSFAGAAMIASSAAVFASSGRSSLRAGTLALAVIFVLAQPMLWSAVAAGAFVQLWTAGLLSLFVVAAQRLSLPEETHRGVWLLIAALTLAFLLASSPIWPAAGLTWLVWRLMQQDESAIGAVAPGFAPRAIHAAELALLPLGVAAGIGLGVVCGPSDPVALFEGIGHWLSEAGGPELVGGRFFAEEVRVGPASLLLGLLSGVPLVLMVPATTELIMRRRHGDVAAQIPVATLLWMAVGASVVLGALSPTSVDLRLLSVVVFAVWGARGVVRLVEAKQAPVQRRAMVAVLLISALAPTASALRSEHAGLNWQQPVFEALSLSAASPLSAPVPLSLFDELQGVEALGCYGCASALRRVSDYVAEQRGGAPGVLADPYGREVLDFGLGNLQPEVEHEVITRGAARPLLVRYRPLASSTSE